MSDLVRSNALLPVVSQVALSFRLATLDDLPFMDGLQRKQTKALGYFTRVQFEGYIEMGGVLIAEERVEGSAWLVGCGKEAGEVSNAEPQATSHPPQAKPVGYCISRDRYLKRDELGVIFQLCVAPGVQRKLVGASLIQEVFNRSMYGCRLYCCWCAQDLYANKFWESMGFVPIAFRGGSRKKSRVHIFWQKRIRAGDTTTAWWYPAKTEGGAIREDRLVFPIPRGLHWSDAMPVLTPAEGTEEQETPKVKRAKKVVKPVVNVPEVKPVVRVALQFGPPSVKRVDAVGPVVEVKEVAALNGLATVNGKSTEQALATVKPKAKVDPRLVAAARELRDRWLEEVNRSDELVPAGKYQLARSVEDVTGSRDARVLPVKRVSQLQLIQQAA